MERRKHGQKIDRTDKNYISLRHAAGIKTGLIYAISIVMLLFGFFFFFSKKILSFYFALFLLNDVSQ